MVKIPIYRGVHIYVCVTVYIYVIVLKDKEIHILYMTATLYETITGGALVVVLEVARASPYNCKDCLEQKNADLSSLMLSILYFVCCLFSSCRVIALTCSCSCAFIRALYRQSRSWRDAVVLLHTPLSSWPLRKTRHQLHLNMSQSVSVGN